MNKSNLANTEGIEEEAMQKKSFIKHDKNITDKPQLNYNFDVNNNEKVPFVPKLKIKYNLKSPLPSEIIEFQQNPNKFLENLNTVKFNICMISKENLIARRI